MASSGEVEVRVHSLLPFGSSYWAVFTAAPEETWSFLSGVVLGALIPCIFFLSWMLAHTSGSQGQPSGKQLDATKISTAKAARAGEGASEENQEPTRENGTSGLSNGSQATTDPNKATILALVQRLENSWTPDELVHDDGRLKVWHRPEGGSFHSFKYETIMPFQPAPCVALAREVDLMPTWHKFISRAVILEDIVGVFGGIYAYCELWMPWPLKNRALLMKTAVYDALDGPTNAFVVDVSSSEYPGDPSRLPTTAEECPRLAFKSYTAFTPLPPDENGSPQSKWTLYFDHTDYQVPNLPTFVLAFFYKVMAPFVVQIATQLVRTSFQPGSEYARRMDANPAFYRTIAERCERRAQTTAHEARPQSMSPSRPSTPRRLAGLRTLARPPPKKSISCPQQLDLLVTDLVDERLIQMRQSTRLFSRDDALPSSPSHRPLPTPGTAAAAASAQHQQERASAM